MDCLAKEVEDPLGRVGVEATAARRVELLRGADEPTHAFGDEVLPRDRGTLQTMSDERNETHVSEHELVLDVARQWMAKAVEELRFGRARERCGEDGGGHGRGGSLRGVGCGAWVRLLRLALQARAPAANLGALDLPDLSVAARLELLGADHVG